MDDNNIIVILSYRKYRIVSEYKISKANEYSLVDFGL